MELRRRLRQNESQAQAHGRLVVEQANAELLTMHRQEEEMQAQLGAWGSKAQQEITSLLNSAQATAYGPGARCEQRVCGDAETCTARGGAPGWRSK